MSDDPKVNLGKGRPTPKRSESERRRGGPVPPPPTTRREAAKRLRASQSAGRGSSRTGGGSVGHLLPRDAGPVRALVRDVVDQRRNIAVLTLPVALVLVLAQFTRNVDVLAVAVRLWTLTLVAVAADLVLTGRAIRRRLRAEFPDQQRLRSHIGYGLLRSTVVRRWRQPRARVSPPRLLGRR